MVLKYEQDRQIRSQVALELLLIQAQAVLPPEAAMMNVDRRAPYVPNSLNSHAVIAIQKKLTTACEGSLYEFC